MRPAPFHADVARAPEGVAALWLTTGDGIRIRVAAHRPEPAKGTILLFPGRTEFIEKYGAAMGEFAARGYATLVVDWRGQGLADRPEWEPKMGHVEDFIDYQHDVSAMLEAARAMELPEPFFLVAHSMGGCIGLRAVMDRRDFRAAAFSAPMWEINLKPLEAPIARPLAAISTAMGMGRKFAPGTKPQGYVETAEFNDNSLTSCREEWEAMKHQVARHPDLALGGPSLHWLNAAFQECLTLSKRPSPDLPVLCFIGSHERVVVVKAVDKRMDAWPHADYRRIPGAEHEVMMEQPGTRKRFFDAACALFDSTL